MIPIDSFVLGAKPRPAVGTDYGTARHAISRGHEVRLRGRQIAHVEEGAKTAIVISVVHFVVASHSRSGAFTVSNVGVRSGK